MAKIGFVGFGEVNTPVDVIIRKVKAAEEALKAEGLDLISVYPVADDYEVCKCIPVYLSIQHCS